jgi:hypothetical protein
MSATPISVAATLRGKAAVNEVRDLLDQLATVDELVVRCDGGGSEFDGSGEGLAQLIDITPTEVLEVIARRRSAITNKLENKGIRIAPDPEPIDLGTLPKTEVA